MYIVLTSNYVDFNTIMLDVNINKGHVELVVIFMLNIHLKLYEICHYNFLIVGSLSFTLSPLNLSTGLHSVVNEGSYKG